MKNRILYPVLGSLMISGVLLETQKGTASEIFELLEFGMQLRQAVGHTGVKKIDHTDKLPDNCRRRYIQTSSITVMAIIDCKCGENENNGQ